MTTVDARSNSHTATTSGTDQFTRVLSGATDSGTLMWSASNGGLAAVGGLTHSEGGWNRYNLIEGFVAAAADGTNTTPGTSTFTPAGSPYGVTSPGNGGGVGGAFSGLADAMGAAAAPAAGVLDSLGQLGRVWSGAGRMQQIHSVGAQLLNTVATLGPEVFKKYCFAAGTPLLTPDGSKNIEDFRPGDLVLSRDEWDPTGPGEPKLVEEVFNGTAAVVDLHVGGEVIRTTAEHLFWVRGHGWTAVGDFEPGYELVGHDGQRTRVQKVTEVGKVVAIYNLRIADHHTYFVGTAEWGWSVWAHNEYTKADEEKVFQALAHDDVDKKTARRVAKLGYNLSDEDAAELVRMAESGELAEKVKTNLPALEELPEAEPRGRRPGDDPGATDQQTPAGEPVEPAGELPTGVSVRRRGVIYATDDTPSGDLYVGSANDLEERDANSEDGRIRTEADVLDYFLEGDLADRYTKEREQMDAHGGKENLDNSINPPDPDNLSWEQPYKPGEK